MSSLDRPHLAALRHAREQSLAAGSAAPAFRRPTRRRRHPRLRTDPACACRLCRAALVCRRWFEISTRPELVRQVEFSSYGRAGAATLRAAQALLLWLHQHGQAVGRLKVAMGLENLSETELAELMSLLDSWLAVCGGRLERLDVLFEENVTVGGWIAAMPRLTDLTLAPLLTLTTWVTLERLTSLQRLHLGAYEWELDTAVSLPASLTCLRIESHTTPEMPHQVRMPGADPGKCVTMRLQPWMCQALGLCSIVA